MKTFIIPRIMAYLVALLTNRRTRSAVLALFFGMVGGDMLALESHQKWLFLLIGGPLLAVAVLCGILALTQAASWAILSGITLAFLEFWAIARFFEYLSHTDRSFERLLRESNDPVHQLDPAPSR